MHISPFLNDQGIIIIIIVATIIIIFIDITVYYYYYYYYYYYHSYYYYYYYYCYYYYYYYYCCCYRARIAMAYLRGWFCMDLCVVSGDLSIINPINIIVNIDIAIIMTISQHLIL